MRSRAGRPLCLRRRRDPGGRFAKKSVSGEEELRLIRAVPFLAWKADDRPITGRRSLPETELNRLPAGEETRIRASQAFVLYRLGIGCIDSFAPRLR